MKIGIAGIGRLGSAVAERLLQSGFNIGVWNRSPDKMRPLEGKGAKAYATPAALALASDCVLTLLTDLDALRAVYSGPEGLLACEQPRLYIELSTVPPSAHQELAGLVCETGSTYLECPVVGSRDAALAGGLLALAAGEPEAVERAKPVLDALSRRVVRVGGIGAAASVKLALNLPLIVYFEVMAEALRLVEHLNLDPHLMMSLLAESTGGPNLLRIKDGGVANTLANALAGKPLPPPQNTVAVFTKDLQIMLTEAKARGLHLPATSVALSEYRKIEAFHPGDIDGMRLPALLLGLQPQ